MGGQGGPGEKSRCPCISFCFCFCFSFWFRPGHEGGNGKRVNLPVLFLPRSNESLLPMGCVPIKLSNPLFDQSPIHHDQSTTIIIISSSLHCKSSSDHSSLCVSLFHL